MFLPLVWYSLVLFQLYFSLVLSLDAILPIYLKSFGAKPKSQVEQ